MKKHLQYSSWRYLVLDGRSLSLFRILLGLSLLYNLWIKSFYMLEFWGENPLIPLAVFRALNGANAFSIFDWIRSDIFAQFYFIACLISYSLLTLGFRTRWTAALSCFLYWNMLQATASFAFGFDLYSFQLLFWACFLPLNQHWRLGPPPQQPKPAKLIFSVLLLYQIAWVYFATGMAKYGASWLEGYAVQNMLMDQWATTSLGQYLSDKSWFYGPATYATLLFECLFPLLLFLPFKKLRYLASGFLLLFHLSIFITYDVANFSISGFAVALLILPSDFWAIFKLKSAQKTTTKQENRYLKYISYTLCSLAFVVISSKNIFFLSKYSALRKTQFAKVLNKQLPYLEPIQLIRVSFFTQYWRMYAPNPPFKVGWLALERVEGEQNYDLIGQKVVEGDPQINWSPKGLEFYLMMYARNFNFPSGQGERYKVFLKYWIPYQLKKQKFPLSSLDNIRLVEYQYYIEAPPYPKAVTRDPYRVRKIVEQDLTKLRMGHKFKEE